MQTPTKIENAQGHAHIRKLFVLIFSLFFFFLFFSSWSFHSLEVNIHFKCMNVLATPQKRQ